MNKTSITEVHNVVTIYGLNEDGSPAETPVAMFSRPQDWGDKERWHYEFFRLEWKREDETFINNCHCYTDIKEPGDLGYPGLFAKAIIMILIPGTPKELCGRDYLAEDDFWLDEWGKMPPFFIADVTGLDYYNFDDDDE